MSDGHRDDGDGLIGARRPMLRGLALVVCATLCALGAGTRGADAQASCPQWVNQSAATQPEPSPKHTELMALAWNEATGDLMAFGGFTPLYNPRGERTEIRFEGITWKWAGDHWDLLANDPTIARAGCTMAFDRARGELILFGGGNVAGGSADLRETRVWNGSQWVLRDANGPAFGITNLVVFDPVSQTVLAVPKVGTYGTLMGREVWSWNGLRWTRADTPDQIAYVKGLAVDRELGLVRAICDFRSGPLRGNRLADWTGNGWSPYAGARPLPLSLWSGPVSSGVGLLAYWDQGPWYLVQGAAFTRVEGPQVRYGDVGWLTIQNPIDLSLWRFGLSRDPQTGEPLAGDYRSVVRWDGQIGAIEGQPGQILSDGQAGRPLVLHATINQNGQGNPAYQWKRYGIALEDNGVISGSHTDTLTIHPMTASLNGSFEVSITTPCGTLFSWAVNISVPSCLTDLNRNGTVDSNDLTILLGAFGDPPDTVSFNFVDPPGIDTRDLVYFLARFGRPCDP